MSCKGCEERRKKFREAYEKAKKSLTSKKAVKANTVKNTNPGAAGEKADKAETAQEK